MTLRKVLCISLILAFPRLIWAQESGAEQGVAVTEEQAAPATVTQPKEPEGSSLPPELSSELSQLKPKKHQADATSGTGLGDMVMGLMAVLGLIVLLAWVGKRLNVNGVTANQSLKLQSVLSLGTKEKIAIINVEGKRLLVGITPHSINVLSELDKGSGDSTETTVETLPFAQQIKKALKQGKLGENSSL